MANSAVSSLCQACKWRRLPEIQNGGPKRFNISLRIEYSKEDLRLSSRKNDEKGDDFHF